MVVGGVGSQVLGAGEDSLSGVAGGAEVEACVCQGGGVEGGERAVGAAGAEVGLELVCCGEGLKWGAEGACVVWLVVGSSRG